VQVSQWEIEFLFGYTVDNFTQTWRLLVTTDDRRLLTITNPSNWYPRHSPVFITDYVHISSCASLGRCVIGQLGFDHMGQRLFERDSANERCTSECGNAGNLVLMDLIEARDSCY
jgi:hypothetical protein